MISHTACKDVTPGYWWARYEGFGQQKEWLIVEVKGHVPFLEVYELCGGAYQKQPMPLRYEGRSPEGSDVYIEFELIFYSRVDGPPQEDE